MLKSENYKKGTLYSIGFNILGKGLQIITILIISYLFGANADTDLYYYLLNLVLLIIASFFSGMDISVIIPQFIKLRERNGEKRAMKFVNGYLLLYFTCSVIFFCCVLVAPVDIFSFLSRFDASLLASNSGLLVLAAFTLIFVLQSNLLASVLASYRYFTIPNLVAFINSFISLTFLLLFYERIGIQGAFMGLAVGYIINYLFLITLVIKKLKWNFFSFSLKKDRHMVKLIASTQLIGGVISGRGYVTQLLLSGLSSGTLTAINWGSQIASLPDTFVNGQVNNMVGLKFSEYYSKREENHLASLFYSALSILLSFSFAVGCIFWFFSADLLSIFDLKKQFTASTATVIADTLKFFSVIVFVNVFSSLASKIFAAVQIIHKIFLLSFIGHILLVVCVWKGIAQFGYMGYLIGSLIGFGLIAALNFFLLTRLMKAISMKKVGSIFLSNLVKFSGIVLAAIAFKYLLERFFTNRLLFVITVSVFIFLLSFLSYIRHRVSSGINGKKIQMEVFMKKENTENANGA